MPIDPALVQPLWDAFPTGYFEAPGSRTVGGHACIRFENKGVGWLWTDSGKVSRAGTDMFNEAKKRLELLPDPSDPITREAMKRLLARRANLDGDAGLLWIPKASSGSSRKTIVGWTLRNASRQVRFKIQNEPDPVLALLAAIALTNCACGRGLVRHCPIHGENSARPWR